MNEGLDFRNPIAMSWAEMQDYIAELESRIRRADRGSKIFAEERELARAEALAEKQIANMTREQLNIMLDVCQRKVSALAGIVEASTATCNAWHEYDVANRMLMHHIEGICRWLNGQVIKLDDPAKGVQDPEFPDDIPF